MKLSLIALLFLGLSSTLMSQDYSKEWQEVEALQQKRLPKSAFEKANAIFEKALIANNQEQIVKSIFYLQNLSSQLEEIEYDSRSQKEIKYIEKHMERVSGGAKSILISFLASKYSQFLDQNYWKIKDRTKNTGSRAEDLALWTMEDLENQTIELYLKSLEDELNKKVKIAQYSHLISNSDSKYCQTLYDFLARRAIQALSDERHYMTQPANAFQPTLEHFSAASSFIKAPIRATLSDSKKYTVLKLYQSLLAEHIEDADPTIFIDIELQRLAFVYNNLEHENKSDLYKKNLMQLFEKYKSHSEAYYALLTMAQVLQSESYGYASSKDSSLQWRLKESVAVCDQIIANCSDNNIVGQAKNHRNGILQSIQFMPQLEKVNLPNKPLLGYLQYTSMDKIYYRIYHKPIDVNSLHEDSYDQKDRFRKIFKNTIVHQGSFHLTNPGDYMSHTTELDFPALPIGNYTIVYSKNPDFDFGGNLLHAVSTSVSNLAYFHHREDALTDIHLYTVDRTNGQPLSGVEVSLYQTYWTTKRQTKFIQTLTSNNGGMIQYPIENYQNNNYFFVLKKGSDVLNELQEDYFYRDNNKDQVYISDHYALFLDREIYRPDQTIYFKGIAYQSSNKAQPKLLTNKSVEVIFRDANQQEIAKKNFQTNEYGTFHGEFTAPKGGLLGRMSLSANNNTTKEVRVEEYKRPSFEVLFDTFSQQVKLGQEVKIQGTGKAYSGANLPNAAVKYTVMRGTNYPYWRCWWIPIPNEEKQIAFGETKTDENGKFNLSFISEPGKDNPLDKNPIFQYTVKIEMTDITGEMQMGSTTVSVGKVDFQLNADVRSTYTKNEKLEIPLFVQNINGQKIDKKLDIKLIKLFDPAVLYQNRYWEKPELYVISEPEFRKKFPYFPYGNEDRIENYKKGSIVYSSSKQANKTTGLEGLSLDIKTYKGGAYKLTLSALDQEGKELSIDKYFTILDEQDLSKNKPVHIQNLKSNYQPGEKTNIGLTGSQTRQRIWYSIIRKNQTSSQSWTDGYSAKLVLDLKEEDRGGAYLLWTSIWNNRLYSNKEYLNIPFTNKDLDIEYTSFRDKLAPGQQEEWRIKIKGKKGDKVMAEVLANMYDQSLDVFAPNNYSFFPYTSFTENSSISSHSFAAAGSEVSIHSLKREQYYGVTPKEYPYLLWQDSYYGGGYSRSGRGKSLHRMSVAARGEAMDDGAVMEMAAAPMATEAVNGILGEEKAKVAKTVDVFEAKAVKTESKKGSKKSDPIKVRTNLNETVFFLPNLQTDAEGNVVIKFKMNEALTKWKFMTLATTKDLQVGISEKSIVTQKDLMIQPNAPRFMRENDEIVFTSRLTNLSSNRIYGWAKLELMNAENNQDVHEKFGLTQPQQIIDIEAGQTKAVEWKLQVPENISALTYRVLAKAGSFSDGEENTLPVLTDRMMVTETMPFHLRANTSKTFDFKEMTEKIKSPTLRSKVFTLEYSANPVWYAIQSLPYLMEYPYECTEQIFSRFFANSLSSSIVQRYPKIQSVFESWKGTDAMLSNLSKNQELKSALLEETPWVLDAQSEEEQRKNISVLFNLTRLAEEEKSAIDKLHMRQGSSGSFPWFPGGPDNPYMTQYVLEGMGHLSFLGVKSYETNDKAREIIDRGIRFLDANIIQHYEDMKKWVLRSKGNLNDDHLDPFAIHYLYTRSFFNHPISNSTQKVIDYYSGQGKKYWVNKSIYQQGMLALSMHRKKDNSTTPAMMKSFRERAKVNEDKGMYWDNDYGYFWYELPIETHSLMTEVFEYLSENQTEKDNLKLFLLKNKQTNRWKTTKATASAIYALLGGKNDKLELPSMPTIKLGEEVLDFSASKVEQGTSYIKKSWKEDEIKANFSKIEVSNPNANVSWGAVYWQYLETMNNIKTNQSSPLKVQKKIFIVTNTEKGEVLEEATATNITIGTKLRIRLTLMVEREMEFLHLKDMRSAGLEPKDAISGYKWSSGLGYYQTTRDASMNFFIDRIYKGTYTIEYDLKTNLKGKFSNGITTFQSMYAPEFNSHSQGQEVIIK
jgi:5-hydroxyisourate hydrolase-like protein (transthyretin family)